MQHLLGSEFLFFAPNGAIDSWLHRPAESGDARRALRFVLMLACRFKSEQAVQFNPCGFRHILVIAGQQPKAFGIVSEGDLEKLGRWTKGSLMPGRYDSAAGVSELRTCT